MEKKPASHVVCGVILGLISIVLFLVYYFTGLAFQNGAMSWLPTLITVALMIYFIVQYSNAHGNNVTYGSLFGYGFRITIIMSLIVVASTALMLYIFPDYKEKIIEQASNRMNGQANMTEDQKDVAIKMVDKFFTISVIGGSLFINILVGIVASLIGAAIAKKNPVSPFNQPV